MADLAVNGNFGKEALKDLQAIASEAYGHRSGEKEAGGMGYMGLMRRADGTVSVFKCLTHKAEYKAFEGAFGGDYEHELRTASDNLKTELRFLARKAGLQMDALEAILNEAAPKAGFLSRKIVAKAVTEIAKAAVTGGDAKAFWKTVTFAGTVKDTRLAAAEEGETIGLKSAAGNVAGLTAAQAMAAADDGLPTGFKELSARLVSGDLGKGMLGALDETTDQLSNICPKVSFDLCPDTAIAFGTGKTWIYDRHASDVLFGHTTLADPRKLTGWNRVCAQLFRLALERAVGEASNELFEGEATIRSVLRRAYFRAYYTAAALEAACKLAAKKGLGRYFELQLLLSANDPESVATQEQLLRKVSGSVENEFDGEKLNPTKNEQVAKLLLAGMAADESEEGEREALRGMVRGVVSLAYSAVKVSGGENVDVEDDGGHTVKLNDYKYRFDGGAALGVHHPGEVSGDDFVRDLFEA